LTDGGKRSNLLGSMYARVEDASQRPVTFACGGWGICRPAVWLDVALAASCPPKPRTWHRCPSL